MLTMKLLLSLVIAILAVLPLSAQDVRKVEVTVEGVARFALVHAPPQNGQPAPLVFAWHGHGGSAQNSARTFAIHRLWPEAVVVYPEGIPTAGRTDPDGALRGWQQNPTEFGGRDIKFFDALLARARKDFAIDEKRIYSTGHSNGAAFTYLLWGARPDVFAALAPSAGVFRPLYAGKPIPVLHVAVEKDGIVPFRGQQLNMAMVRRINGCEGEPQQWGDTKGALLYPSKNGTPFVSYIHCGGHNYATEAPGLIVRFLKEHAKKVIPESTSPRATGPRHRTNSASAPRKMRKRFLSIAFM